MTFSAKTDVGLKRKINQDYFDYGQLGDNACWLAVCDGMGGMVAGNVASETAVKCLARSFGENLSSKSPPAFIRSFLEKSVASANAVVFDMADADNELRGMGTTVVAAVVVEGVCYVAHAGDSRLYKIQDGVLSQVTTDHSVVQTMVDSGQLTEEQAKIHPNKNIITRALGVRNDIDVDFTEFKVSNGDIIFLCSDGLTNCVDDEEILNVMKNNDFSLTADILVDIANNNGGIDNITIVAVKI